MRRLCVGVGLGALVLVFVGLGGASARRPVAPKHRVIIKFSSEVILHWQEGRPVAIDDQLNKMFTQFNALRAKPVFKGALDMEALRRRFPERAKRMPKPRTAVSLEHIYLFIFKTTVSGQDIAQALQAHPEVIYAHPDAAREIQ